MWRGGARSLPREMVSRTPVLCCCAMNWTFNALLSTAWAAGDDEGLDDAWVDQIADLGAQWGQYEYVTNIGFAA